MSDKIEYSLILLFYLFSLHRLECRPHDVFLFDFTIRGGSVLVAEIYRNTQLVANSSMKSFSPNICSLLVKNKKKIISYYGKS